MDLYSLSISNWETYQPRKDLTKLTWFRVDTGIFNGQTYYLLKNNGLILFMFLLTLAASSNNSCISLSLDYLADKLKFKKEDILVTIKILESLQLVHSFVQVCTDLSPTLQTNKQTNSTVVFDFESAYNLYPLKMGKSDGMKKLKKEIKTNNDLELFKTAINNYKKELERSKTDRKYFKHFSTFVNCWRDFIFIEQESKPIKFERIKEEFLKDSGESEKNSTGTAFDNPELKMLIENIKNK